MIWLVKCGDFKGLANLEIFPSLPRQSFSFGHNLLLRCQNRVPFAVMETRHSHLSNSIKCTFWFYLISPCQSFKHDCPVSRVHWNPVLNSELMLKNELVVDRFWKWFLLWNCSLKNLVSNATNHAQIWVELSKLWPDFETDSVGENPHFGQIVTNIDLGLVILKVLV